MEKDYVVIWRIDLSGSSPQEVAEKAREIQLDPNSLATFFEVKEQESPLTPGVLVEVEPK